MKTPSVEPVLRSRLLPRISFRQVFIATALAALLGAIGRSAGEGGAIATAAMFMVLTPLVCFGLFFLVFVLSWLVSSLWYESNDDTQQGSPFAAGQLPPQILPPRDPKS